MSTLPRVAILGLGAMGSRVAAHVLDAGYPLTVWNRSAEAATGLVATGAKLGMTPRAAAAAADIVIAYLKDDEVSRAVWLDAQTGALAGLSPESIAVESSSLSPGYVKELASAVVTAGATFLEAPVAGSRPQAESKTLVALVGGAPDTLERVRAVLAIYCHKIFHVGGTGAGAALKLGVNTFLATQVVGVAELLTNMREQGLAEADVLSIISELPTTSAYIKVAAGLMVADNDAPVFTIDLIEKDLRYAANLAAENELQLTLLEATHRAMLDAKNAGLGAKNITAVIKSVRTRRSR